MARGGEGVTAASLLGPRYHLSEKTVQHACVTLFRAAGCVVCSLSQPRRTMQAEGLADLYVLVPRRRTAFWFETKSERGRQSEAQKAFQISCEACGVLYRMGGLEEAKALLGELGLTA